MRDWLLSRNRISIHPTQFHQLEHAEPGWANQIRWAGGLKAFSERHRYECFWLGDDDDEEDDEEVNWWYRFGTYLEGDEPNLDGPDAIFEAMWDGLMDNEEGSIGAYEMDLLYDEIPGSRSLVCAAGGPKQLARVNDLFAYSGDGLHTRDHRFRVVSPDAYDMNQPYDLPEQWAQDVVEEMASYIHSAHGGAVPTQKMQVVYKAVPGALALVKRVGGIQKLAKRTKGLECRGQGTQRVLTFSQPGSTITDATFRVACFAVFPSRHVANEISIGAASFVDDQRETRCSGFPVSNQPKLLGNKVLGLVLALALSAMLSSGY